MDFIQTTYETLIQSLQKKFSNIHTFKAFIQHSNASPLQQSIILRHDVDRLPQNSLQLAQLEHSLCIKGTYYFRVVPESYNLEIMHKIAELGHEIGYHYEDVDLVYSGQRSAISDQKGAINENKLIDLAYESFCKNLELFRKNFDIKTVCMHGSPRSKYDNKLIWKKYDYKKLGIIGEPYYDIDFNEFAYFTDTGRRWNGHKYSVRDKVDSKYNFDFKATREIIENVDKLPDKVMFTIHPERWFSHPEKLSDFIFHTKESLPWLQSLFVQNAKNIVKRILISVRNRK